MAKSSSAGAAPSTPPSSVTVSSSPAPAATSTGVKSPVIQPAVKSPSRSESVSVSSLVSTSSTPSAQTVITNTKTSSSMLQETPKPSDISYSSARSPSSPPAVTLNTRYSYQTPSAPLDDLADTLLPTRSGSVQSQPVRSQTQVTTVYSEIPAASPTLRSPLQTLESSRTVSSRDVCTVCGKPIAGSERMILEDLKIISHASCFRVKHQSCLNVDLMLRAEL
ncbi:endochitinase A [Sinocyclocheilus rhinocerous]|uniref:endochitinase A n=1 Tax=Sinocyclocheilus rhinocerous TaxID=307959 RepID=UPI0007B865BC|nr:PREDICTED: endochitinase A-like [Sinocyclocheilus rhinocerous]